MSYTLYQTVSFGSSKAGLATVGYCLYDTSGTPVGSRTTSGIQELGGGQYGATITFADGFRGRITWDSGEVSPVYASDSVNPETAENDKIEVTLLEQLTSQTTGPTVVDHNYGGANNLTYQTSDGVGIDGATITIYTVNNYDAGLRTAEYVVGRSFTKSDGTWIRGVALSPGSYAILFFLQHVYGPDRKDITVT